MKKFKFQANKLIRDKMPEIYPEKGMQITTHIMNNGEYLKMIQEKMLEEIKEAFTAKTEEKRIGELADAIEAMHKFCELFGFSMQDVEKIRLQKQLQKGKYDNKIFCETIEMEENNPKLQHYLDNSDRYSLIK